MFLEYTWIIDYTVIGKRPSSYQIVGETVHRAGAVGGDATGTITRKYVTVFFNPSESYYPNEVKFLGQIEAVFNGGEGGDSGAPVFKVYYAPYGLSLIYGISCFGAGKYS